MDQRTTIQQQDGVLRQVFYDNAPRQGYVFPGPIANEAIWRKLENMECRLTAALDPTGASAQSVELTTGKAWQSVQEFSAAVASANSAAQVAGTAAEVTSAAAPILRKLEAMEDRLAKIEAAQQAACCSVQ